MLGHNRSMLVAALDTTTRLGSVAIVRDQRVLAAAEGDGTRPHAERLPGSVTGILADLGLRLADVEAFAVVVGPGSFTGLRIGLSSIQGMAFATGRPVVGVSAFDAFATACFLDHPEIGPGPIAIWLDAQRQEVFTAVLRAAGEGAAAGEGPVALAVVDPPAVATAAATLARWKGEEWCPALTYAGEGARVYRGVIVEDAGHGAKFFDKAFPLAPAVGLIAELRAQTGKGVPPHALRPLYIRRPDAELARERARSQRP